MSRLVSSQARNGRPIWWLALGVASALALALAALVWPKAVAQGWLVAFAAWSGIPIGALVLLLIHVLTGGRRGNALMPVLRPLIATLPLLVLAFLPVALALPAIFPWATQPVEPPSLGHFYLNAPAFLLRAAVALLGFCACAILLLRGQGTRLLAGLGLAFYGLIINLVAVDWILSVEPGFGSSAFGMEIAVQQMLSALAVAALIAPEPDGDRVTDDLGGLLIATLLGLVYIGSMTFIVSWYGDLPDNAAWYLARSRNGWAGVIVAALVIGALFPMALLLRRHVRGSRGWLRLVGALVLIGVTLHVAWLMGPALASYAMLAAGVAFAALAGLSVGLAGTTLTFLQRDASHA